MDNNNDFIGFVPHRMDIAESVMYHFPQNVLFGKCGIKNGKNIMGTALYEPDLESFKQEGEKYSMKYRNAYGGDCWLRITYSTEGSVKYHGEKFVNGKSVGMADGGDNWDMFFIHFAMLGLANGERCEFEEIAEFI